VAGLVGYRPDVRMFVGLPSSGPHAVLRLLGPWHLGRPLSHRHPVGIRRCHHPLAHFLRSDSSIYALTPSMWGAMRIFAPWNRDGERHRQGQRVASPPAAPRCKATKASPALSHPCRTRQTMHHLAPDNASLCLSHHCRTSATIPQLGLHYPRTREMQCNGAG